MTSPAEQIIGLYERHAHRWDRVRGRSLMEREWLDLFASLVPAGGTVRDLGWGSGEPIARYLAERGFRIHGVDSSPTLVEMCRGRFPAHAWEVGDMRALALGSRFDGLVAWDSFFHLPWEDQRRMFPVFREHANAGAALLSPADPRTRRRSAPLRERRCTTPAWRQTSTVRCCTTTAFAWSGTWPRTPAAAATPSGWRSTRTDGPPPNAVLRRTLISGGVRYINAG